jgi:hypothetical protein
MADVGSKRKEPAFCSKYEPRKDDQNPDEDIAVQPARATPPVVLINNSTLKPCKGVSFSSASEDCNNMHAWLVNSKERLLCKVSLHLNRLDDLWTLNWTVWPIGSPMPAPQCAEELESHFPNRAARAANTLCRAYLADGFCAAAPAERKFFKVHENEHDGEEFEEEEDEE